MNLEESRTGRFTIVTSDYLIQELLCNPNPDQRANTLAMSQYAGLHVPVMDSVASRASQIESLAITASMPSTSPLPNLRDVTIW